MPTALHFTDDPSANELLAADPTALVIGMVLYQQVPIEKAFSGPEELRRRLGGTLDVAAIADLSPEEIDEAFREKPALHRFPGNMAKRAHAVCIHIVEHHEGRVEALWENVTTADEVMSRLKALPGFGDYKARVYFGVLAERFGVRPAGWESYMPDWPSIVDITQPADLPELKERKKAWKAAGGSES